MPRLRERLLALRIKLALLGAMVREYKAFFAVVAAIAAGLVLGVVLLIKFVVG